MDNKDNIINTEFKLDLDISVLASEKIDALQTLLPNTEWSGIMFVKLSEEEDIFIVRDILPMNIGSSVYTEFSISEDVAHYMVMNDLLDCSINLIHSHHDMDASFSSTDINTLYEVGSNLKYFISLIVNNSRKYCAKTICQSISNKHYLKFEFEKFSSATNFNTPVYKILDMNISIPERSNNIPSDIQEFVNKNTTKSNPSLSLSALPLFSPQVEEERGEEGEDTNVISKENINNFLVKVLFLDLASKVNILDRLDLVLPKAVEKIKYAYDTNVYKHKEIVRKALKIALDEVSDINVAYEAMDYLSEYANEYPEIVNILDVIFEKCYGKY